MDFLILVFHSEDWKNLVYKAGFLREEHVCVCTRRTEASLSMAAKHKNHHYSCAPVSKIMKSKVKLNLKLK